ncbi:MAG TPA: hypothetical protein VM261_17535 [Kofleriaceae bacterium]|nr:hypothetical protein [Kofleriaceae bacterium]
MGAAIVLVGWLARPRAQPAGDAAAPLVYAPGPEVEGAAERGKVDTAAALKLARKKQYVEAVAILERVALAHPSVVHDCNLSLAYLRAGQLTRAQLVWDVSRLRGATPPDWCDASLSGQLATALRAKTYVPLTINVQPQGALIEVNGVSLRDMSLVWLPPATYQIRVTHAGWHPQLQPVLVAPPSASASILLVQLGDPTIERDAAVATPDAGVAASSADAGVAADVDAATDVDFEPPPPPPAARAKWPAYAGIGAAGLGLGLGVAFHARALGTKDRANMLPTDSMGFRDAKDRFGTERTLAIGGYVVSAAAIGFTTWWLLGKDQGEPPATTRTVGLEPRGDGAVLTFGGTLR